MKRILGPCLLAGLLSVVGVFNPVRASATATYYVDPAHGNIANSCTDPGQACPTFASAYAKASNGDRINMAVGVYSESPIVITKTLTLAGAGTSRTVWSNLSSVTVTGTATVNFTGFAVTGKSASGIVNGPNASLSLTDMLITNNGSTGVVNNGALSVISSTISSNGNQRLATGQGGGITNFGTADVEATSVISNVGTVAGGIYNGPGAVLTVTNATLTGNAGGTASGPSSVTVGGIRNGSGGKVVLGSVTIARNNGTGSGGTGGIGNTGTFISQNSIVAANVGFNGATTDCVGPSAFTSYGHNLIGDGSGCSGFVNVDNADKVGTTLAPIDPKLGALAFNGGLTPTLALLGGSPASDAGTPSGCVNALTFVSTTSDQRGFPRSGTCDIGAFEVQPSGSGPVSPIATFSLSSDLSSVSTADFYIHFSTRATLTVFTATITIDPSTAQFANFRASDSVGVLNDSTNGWTATFVLQPGHAVAPGTYVLDARVDGLHTSVLYLNPDLATARVQYTTTPLIFQDNF